MAAPRSPEPEMSIERFETLCDAYGGDCALWPVSAQTGAAALLARDPRAARLLAEAAALDAGLSAALAATAPRPSDALVARVMADARHTASATRAPAPRFVGLSARLSGVIRAALDELIDGLGGPRPAMVAMSALCAVAVLGLGAGITAPQGAPSKAEVAALAELAFGDDAAL